MARLMMAAPSRVVVFLLLAIAFSGAGVRHAHALIARPAEGLAFLQWSDGMVDGGTSTLLTIRVTAIYGSNVTGMALQDFAITGGDTSDFVQHNNFMSSVEFTFNGLIVQIEATLTSFSGSVFPPLKEDVSISLRYTPPISFHAEPALTAASTTPHLSLAGIATFGSNVTGVALSDFVLTGCTVTSLTLISNSQYRLEMILDAVQHVQIQVSAAAGSIFPPNAAAVWSLQYTPAVTLQFSDGVTSGDESSLLTMTATAVFGSNVTGASKGDILVAGAVAGNFQQLSSRVFTQEFHLGSAATVTVSVPAASGAVSPPNDAAIPIVVKYRPISSFSLSDGILPGNVTTKLEVTLTVTFATPVTGLEIGDILVTGADSGALVGSGSLYTVALTPTAENIRVLLVPESGVVNPPNRGTSTHFEFNAMVSLALSHGLSAGVTTSLREATLTATFSRDVVFFDKREVTLAGCSLRKFTAVTNQLYTMIVSWGSVETVTQQIVHHAGAVVPPNIASNVINFTFAPAVTLSLDNGLQSGDVHSVVSATLTVLFNAPVSNFALGDIVIVGCKASGFTTVADDEYTVQVVMGQQNNVNFSLPARAGKIYPPNAAAVPISLTYEPSILFTLSDGLGAGSVTTLRTVTATAVFSSDVSGVVKADVLVTNAQYSNFVKVSPSVYTFVLELQEAGDIRLNVIRASGVIEPENAKAQELRFTYAPSVSFSLSDGVKAGDVTPLVTLMATATFGSNVTNVALEDFGKAGVVGADMFMQESPSVYTFRFWVGFTNGITLSIPRFAGNIFPPNERSSLSWTYAPKATWNMSDGIDWGGTTSLRVVTATATFPTAVSLVDDDGFDFLVSGCTKGAWTRHNARVYDIQLFLGFAESVSIYIPWFAGLIFPPAHKTEFFNWTYAPAATLTLSSGVFNGSSTFVTPLLVTATFGDPVRDMQASDVTAVGGSTRDVAQVAPAVYTTLLDLGPLAWVVIGMEARSGHIWPPNAAAKRVTFEYTPTVSFTFSEELLPGDTTGLTNLTVTATFATGVTGVAKSDFIVTGATTHEFAALTKRHYALNISVFNATEYEPNIITVNLEGRSGNIFPPNYPAPMASLLYLFPTTTGRYLVQMKLRVRIDFTHVPPDSAQWVALKTGVVAELVHLLKVPPHRFEVVAVTPHKGRVFLVVSIYPVEEEEDLLTVKSAVTISNEIVAFYERYGRGTFTPPGAILPMIDSFFMQQALFLKCADGTFVFQEDCTPIPVPCGNGTLLNPCPLYVRVDGVLLMLLVTGLFVLFAVTVTISRVKYMRTTQMMQSWGFGSSWAVTITSFFIAPIMWSYSLVWQLQLLAAVAVCKALGTLLFFFVGHYWVFTTRRSRLYDARFVTFVRVFPRYWKLVFALSLINSSSLKLPYMQYFNREQFCMQPLSGWKFVLATIKPVVLILAIAEALALLYIALRTLDENFPDGVDVVLYFTALVPANCIVVHVIMLFKDALKVPIEVYRLIKQEVVRRRSTAKPKKIMDDRIPIPRDSPPSSPRDNFITLRFDRGPLGITLAEVKGQKHHRAFVRFPPTGQAARGDVLRRGDSVWRVNNTVVTSCGFRDIINIIAAVPRPFVVDFVRPTRKLDLGHSVLYNNIQFDMVRVDTPGGEAKVMPAAALRQTASEHSLKLKSKSFANLLTMRQGRLTPRKTQVAPVAVTPTNVSVRDTLMTRSFRRNGDKYRRPRRVALPPLNRVELNEKQAEWGIPVFSVPTEDGSAAPIHSVPLSQLAGVAEGGRRLSVAM